MDYIDYESKYMKYKIKYLKLMNSLNHINKPRIQRKPFKFTLTKRSKRLSNRLPKRHRKRISTFRSKPILKKLSRQSQLKRPKRINKVNRSLTRNLSKPKPLRFNPKIKFSRTKPIKYQSPRHTPQTPRSFPTAQRQPIEHSRHHVPAPAFKTYQQRHPFGNQTNFKETQINEFTNELGVRYGEISNMSHERFEYMCILLDEKIEYVNNIDQQGPNIAIMNKKHYILNMIQGNHQFKKSLTKSSLIFVIDNNDSTVNFAINDELSFKDITPIIYIFIHIFIMVIHFNIKILYLSISDFIFEESLKNIIKATNRMKYNTPVQYTKFVIQNVINYSQWYLSEHVLPAKKLPDIINNLEIKILI